MKYFRIQCACGREFGSNVFRQHARKCLAQLRAWKKSGNSMAMLDERSAKQKAREGLP